MQLPLEELEPEGAIRRIQQQCRSCQGAGAIKHAHERDLTVRSRTSQTGAANMISAVNHHHVELIPDQTPRTEGPMHLHFRHPRRDRGADPPASYAHGAPGLVYRARDDRLRTRLAEESETTATRRDRAYACTSRSRLGPEGWCAVPRFRAGANVAELKGCRVMIAGSSPLRKPERICCSRFRPLQWSIRCSRQRLATASVPGARVSSMCRSGFIHERARR